MTAAHMTDDIDWRPADGWYRARCSCGWSGGPFPDLETMVDALMDHAALAATPPGGREDEADRERRRFREELDREEDVRGALHPVICDHEHNPATSPEHWRCVIAAHTAVAALSEEAAVTTAEAAAGEEGS